MKRWLSLLLGVALWLGASGAWAQTTNFVNLQTPRADEAQVVNGSSTVSLTATTNYVTLLPTFPNTVGAKGGIITGLYCTSNDTVTHNLAIVRVNGTTLYPLAVAAISAGTATALGIITSVNGIIGDNLLQGILGLSIDPYANPIMQYNSTDTIKIGVLTTVVSSSDAISCWDTGGDY